MNKKKTIQDILPKEHHRSIQDISMADIGKEESNEKKTVRKVEKKSKKNSSTLHNESRLIELKEEEKHFDFHPEYISHVNKPRWNKIGLWFVVIISCILGLALISSFFHNAKVDIKIKEITSDVDTSVNMVRKDESGSLPFEIVSLSKEMRENVPTNGEKQVSIKASGKVVIYNKNTVAQKLISQTRLEAPNGKIFRISATITVPAGKKSGNSIVAGSIETTVTADAPGPDYNLPLTDFTIPGFKGTAKYETIYARSKTPFVNGASGTIKIAAEEDLLRAKKLIHDSLETQLINNVNQQIPNSFILLPNVYLIQYASSTEVTENNTLTLKQKADFVGILVDIKKLSTYLAKKSIPGYAGEDIIVDNLKDLSFELSPPTTRLTVNTNSISLKIKGKPHFIYGYDKEKLKADLAGTSREFFATVISTYGGIENGSLKINPFWRSKFPTDLSKIIINEIR
jgi:hypothetical protein